VLLPLAAIVGTAPEGPGARPRTIHPWEQDAPALASELLDCDAPHLAFAMRSDMGVMPALAERFEALLDALATHERRTELAFAGPAEAVSMLRRGRSPRRPSASDRLGNFRPPG
jgi:hypothetical protein